MYSRCMLAAVIAMWWPLLCWVEPPLLEPEPPEPLPDAELPLPPLESELAELPLELAPLLDAPPPEPPDPLDAPARLPLLDPGPGVDDPPDEEDSAPEDPLA